jgi:hypothetical protein
MGPGLSRTVAVLVVAAGLLAVAGAVQAEVPHRRARRVAVLPTQHLDAPCSQLFAPGERDATALRHLSKALTESLDRLPDIRVLPSRELRRKVAGTSDYREKVVIGRERYHMGHEYYRDLRQPEAEESLGRSIDLLDSIYYDAVEPQAFSEILFLLGITLVEEGKAARAHQAFKRALFLSPLTTFSPGYHPRPVEQALTVACEDLQASLEKEVPFSSVDRTFRFMRSFGIDVLFYPVLIMEGEQRVLLLLGYDRKTSTLAFRHREVLGEPEKDVEAIDRAVSRWVACAPFDDVPERVEERHRYVFSANYQHLVFLQHPLRNPLFTMGFSFDGAHFFKRFFALMAKLQFMSSLPDRFGDMLDGFTSARVMLGPAFSVSGARWRLFVVPSAEFHYIGSFQTTRDPDCKHFLSDSPGYAMCDPGAIKEFPVDFLAGINVHLGAQFFLTNEMFLGFGASASTYFAPFDRSFQMNFPLAAEVGGGIAF